MPPGRPSKEGPPKIPMSISIEADLKASLNKICHRDRITISHVVVSFLRRWAQTHADGNANYLLDQFSDPNMVAVPALMRDSKAWAEWLQANKGLPICHQVLTQIRSIQEQHKAISEMMI